MPKTGAHPWHLVVGREEGGTEEDLTVHLVESNVQYPIVEHFFELGEFSNH